MKQQPTNAEAAYEEQQRKKQRTRWSCCLMGCLPPVGLIVLAIVVGLAWRWRVQQDIQALEDEIRSRGEPLTAKELQQHYALLSNTIDKTQRLNRAFAVFENEEFQDSIGILEFELADMPPEKLSDPWPEHDQARTFLLRYGALFDSIEAAALAEGEFSFPIEFENLHSTDLAHLQQINLSLRMLRLKVLSAVIDGDDDTAFRTIQSMFALANSIERHPLLGGHYHFCSHYEEIAETICRTLPHADWSDEQLQELGDALLAVDWREKLNFAIINERAVGRVAFLNPENRLEGELGVMLENDLHLYLLLMTKSVDATQHGSPKMLAAWQRVFEDVEAVLNSPLRTDLFVGIISPVPSAANGAAYTHVLCQGAATQIAVKRFRMKYGDRPETLIEMRPEFLVSIPVDPHSGEPLRYRPTSTQTLIYSVGENLQDDRGDYKSRVGDPNPDIVIHVYETSP